MKRICGIKPWVLVVCIIAIILIPIAINFLLLIHSFTPIVGDNKNWLSFFSGYLGAVIGAGISLFVMFKTFQNTKRENVYKYENYWLDGFRDKCAAFIDVFNINYVITILKEMALTPDIAYEHCGVYMNRLRMEETKMALICENNKDTKLSVLYEHLKEIQNEYRMMFNSIHAVVCCVRNVEQNQSFDGRMTLTDFSILESDNILKGIINANLDDDGKIAVSKLYKVLYSWVEHWENTYSNISNFLKRYIAERQEEISQEYQKI